MKDRAEGLRRATRRVGGLETPTDPPESIQSLKMALDVGGRALLDSSPLDEASADAYRRALIKLTEKLPAIEERLRSQRTKLEQERDSLERAIEWARESREFA